MHTAEQHRARSRPASRKATTAVSGPLLLCYHAVSESWPAALAVSPSQLRTHVAALARRGFRGITFAAAVNGEADPGAVAITFDDALRSVIEAGLPVLQEAGFPATVFAPTDYVGSERPMSWPGIEDWAQGAHRGELTPMSWSELGALAELGWEIGSHTCSHPRLTELGGSQLDSELLDSRLTIERRLGAPCRSLAYPFGAHDDRVVAAAERAGYTAAAATLPARLRGPTSPLDWPRIVVNRVDGPRRFSLKTSTSLRRLKASPAWTGIVVARRVLRR